MLPGNQSSGCKQKKLHRLGSPGDWDKRTGWATRLQDKELFVKVFMFSGTLRSMGMPVKRRDALSLPRPTTGGDEQFIMYILI
jgi:hypothetical protein